MNRLERLELHLTDSVEGNFRTGEIVQGHLVVSVTGSLKIQGIEVKVKGRGHAEWVETQPDSGADRQLYETEQYIDESIFVYGQAPDKDEGPHIELLDGGRHVMDFQFKVPEHVPSSFEGQHGYIRYWVKAKVYGIWGLLDQSGKVEFGVIRPLDLNAIPGAEEPAEDEDVCMVCGCCLSSGPVTATFSINRRGFVPGEAIVCNAEVHNDSDTTIRATKIKFYRITTYGDCPFESKTTEKQTISEQFRGKIKPGRHELYENEQLSLPTSLPVTSLPGCYFIDVDYVVELKVTSSDEDLHLKIPLLIIIGTVPLPSSTQIGRPRHRPIRDIVANSSPVPEPVTNQPLSFNPFAIGGVETETTPTASAPPMTTVLADIHPPMESFSIMERERTLDDLYRRRRKPKLFRIMTVENEGADIEDDAL